MAKKRITELTEVTTVKPGHYIPVDHGTDGTQKMSMSTLIDSTLSTSGKAADAKATGDSITELDARMDTFTSLPSGSTSGDAELMDIRVGADGTTYQSAGSAVRGQISEIKEELQEIIDGGGGSGMTEEFKYALHNILEQLVYISADGQTYLDALDNALWPATNIESISAVFTQGQNVIYDTDSLNTLKQYLVVTAHYSDSTTEVLTTYTLTGTLSVGTSTITVAYSGKTDTFTVSVTEQRYIPSSYTWLYDAREGELLSEQSYVTVATGGGGGTETMVDNQLVLHTPRTSNDTNFIRFNLSDTTTTNGKLMARVKFDSIATQSNSATGAEGFRLQLSNGTTGAQIFFIGRPNDNTVFGYKYYPGSTGTWESLADYDLEEYHVVEIELSDGKQKGTIDGNVLFETSTLSSNYATVNSILNQVGTSIGLTKPVTTTVDWIAYYEV